jgi:prevent-host-death family protein
MTVIGVADAKRRFSELVDRVGAGERIVVARRGKPAVALVPPSDLVASRPQGAPTGFAAIAGALADWEELDSMTAELQAGRRKGRSRPAPDLD